ncbi:SDR family oxidoreductase [Pedobacter metabolipauper]|uniref:Uncharacterized protein YbjT (DUF2867 family) n=1 Tax=Pedobacter metabolipauper TaxID=425513 RepID=A0A4R6SZ78_9SPHI|nr:SDR family oxidoreductase [Pedobacter metabolipauper]TDQ11079.1 uncharacterized protein YbjT (DUF2867 family) [Pedobacter metabolipauper]
MKILLTGTTGYIGKRLLPQLLEKGHHVTCCVRDKSRFDVLAYKSLNITVIEVDLLKEETLKDIPDDIDAAYYLVHSMSGGGDFSKLEAQSAENFSRRMNKTTARQLIYLSGITSEQKLSKHLSSRKNVEDIFKKGSTPLTVLHAGIIVGSGSASFEIIRDLVEKLPVMIAPKWVHTKCQPVAIRNVLEFLSGVLLRADTFNHSFDIYGPDILTYKEMLMEFAASRKLKRKIWVVPVMTPRLSSYWLYFVTSTSYSLAKNLVESMKIDVVAKPNDLSERLSINLLSYREALEIAFDKIEQNQILSSWTDALSGRTFSTGLSRHIEVPLHGCMRDVKKIKIKDVEPVLDRIFSIGGSSGWYYADWLWGIRGFIDKLFGGVGLRRGRRNRSVISAGESLDFWRVLYANREERRLLLYAEMKLPGEAWLEFKIGKDLVLEQTATFRPLGIMGRLYWYSVLPFHGFIFKGMIRRLAGLIR